jgi:O-antigen/teichoic acid export membrane protein
MIKNIIANFIGKFWSILSNFLFIPLYIHYLGFESYSIISFTLVIAGLMAVLDAGLSSTLSREFSRIDNSHLEKIRIFKTLETSYFIILGISILLVFFLSGIIANKWLNLKTFDTERVSFFLKIISFDVGFQLLFRFYMGGLLGFDKQVQANLYQVGWGVLRNGLVVIAIAIVPTLEMFFIWQTISTILFTLLIGLSLRQSITGHFQVNFQLEKSVFKKVWRFAGGMLLISLVGSLNTQMDKLAISNLLPIESLGYYTLAVSLAMGIIVLVNPISIALLPKFTALYSAGKNKEAYSLFYKINLLVSILVFSITVIMAIFAKELVWIWTGNQDIAEKVHVYIPIIAMSVAMLSLAMLPYNIAIANGYTELNNLIGIVSLIFILPGYWLATKYFGAIGVAYVYCGVQTMSTLVYIYFINKKFLKIKSVFKLLYIKQMLFPLIVSLSVALVFSFIPGWISQNRIYSFIWIGIAASITFVFTILLLVPFSDLKRIAGLKTIKNL